MKKNDEVRLDRVRRESPHIQRIKRVPRVNPQQTAFDCSLAKLKQAIRKIEHLAGSCGAYYVVQNMADILAARDIEQNPSTFIEYEDAHKPSKQPVSIDDDAERRGYEDMRRKLRRLGFLDRRFLEQNETMERPEWDGMGKSNRSNKRAR
jgi:hypothetical protein